MTDYHDEEQQAAEAAQSQLERRKRDADDIRHVMSSEAGRRVIWRVLERGNVFSVIPPVDTQTMAFMEGQRNLALALFQRVMSCCPELYLTMADEANKQE
ncbi:hypothetical protein ACI09J_001777 [Cronobacter turicensis]